MRGVLKNVLPFAAVFVLLMMAVSCQKEFGRGNGPEQISVFLTDGPADFSAVNIEVKYVEVKVDTVDARRHDDRACDRDDDDDDHRFRRDEFGKWDTLAYNPGVYDLLALRNGVEAALGTITVNGVVRKIRLTLGTSNTVVKDGVTYPLELAPGVSPYLYVKLKDEHRQATAGGNAVWVDFDLGRSIIEANGKFFLRPMLKPFCDRNFASVEGKVLPADAKATVTIFNDTDTGTAIPLPNGYFRVRGLKPGTYTVLYQSANGYKEQRVTGVKIEAGKKVSLPDVTMSR